MEYMLQLRHYSLTSGSFQISLYVCQCGAVVNCVTWPTVLSIQFIRSAASSCRKTDVDTPCLIGSQQLFESSRRRPCSSNCRGLIHRRCFSCRTRSSYTEAETRPNNVSFSFIFCSTFFITLHGKCLRCPEVMRWKCFSLNCTMCCWKHFSLWSVVCAACLIILMCWSFFSS